MADGLDVSSGKVDEEIFPLKVIVNQYRKELILDIIGIANHDIILGIP